MYLEKIAKMHDKFMISLVEFSEKEKEFRIEAMQEELDEYKVAKTKEEEFDALIDLLVFTLGTVDRHGWSNVFNEGFDRVMNANMAKELGPNQKRGSFSLDLKKPNNWKAPCHKDLVGE